MATTLPLEKVHKYARACIPQAWYDFKPLHSQLGLVAPEKPLIGWLVITYVLTTVVFFGQVAYYSGITSIEFVVSNDYNLPGHVCRPLQHDPEYGLDLTYDECLANIRPVTNENLISPYTHGFSESVSWDTRDGRLLSTTNGPWNMTTYGPLEVGSAMTPPTYYHHPLLARPKQPYTLNSKCKPSLFPGVIPGLYSLPPTDTLFNMPCDFASVVPDGSAYGPYGVCNKNPAELGFKMDSHYGDYVSFEDNINHHTFIPKAGTDFVTKCKGKLTTTQQTDLYSSGGYAFPRCHATTTDVVFYATTTDVTGRADMHFRPGSIGITPLYPKATTIDAINNGQFAPRSKTPWGVNDTFFGYPRCEFYERQMAKEAYEYIYTLKDCHPCDGFKYNTPFHCEKKVRKTAAEIIALSASNSMAFMGICIAAAPLVFKFVMLARQDEGSSSRGTNESLP